MRQEFWVDWRRAHRRLLVLIRAADHVARWASERALYSKQPKLVRKCLGLSFAIDARPAVPIARSLEAARSFAPR
jgi:hypothetical protein